MTTSNFHYIAADYTKKVSPDHRKKHGQYFTPEPIANLMRRWIISNFDCAHVLDPAVGLGHLLTDFPTAFSAEGYDIDEVILQTARANFKHLSNFHLSNTNFLTSGWDQQYDGIICNPPYIRFKNYHGKEAYLALFQQKMGIKLSGFTNLYVLFLLKSLHQLSSNGRAAFILPSDFLNARYGTPIKEFLLKQQNLHVIVVTDFQVSWFGDAATTSALFFFDNRRKTKEVEFISVTEAAGLTPLADYLEHFEQRETIGKVKTYDQLDPQDKWRIHYQSKKKQTYRNVKPFSAFAQINRGIATGANKYFCLRESERRNWQLPEAYTLPCLSKASHVSGSFLTANDIQHLIKNDEAVLLLNAGTVPDHPNVQRYISYGEATGIDQRYLTRARRPWFKNETRAPAPILAAVFSRNKIKFIRNEANAYNLTAFHCIYPLSDYRQDTDILMAYLLTDIAQEIFSSYHREYGKGLKKFEPSDLKEALVIDLDTLSEDHKKEIRNLYAAIRKEQLGQHKAAPAGKRKELNDLFCALIQP